MSNNPHHHPATHTAAQRIRHLMRTRGISQATLANTLNLSQQAISRRLNATVDFTITELILTAKALNVAPGTLLDPATADDAA